MSRTPHGLKAGVGQHYYCSPDLIQLSGIRLFVQNHVALKNSIVVGPLAVQENHWWSRLLNQNVPVLTPLPACHLRSSHSHG